MRRRFRAKKKRPPCGRSSFPNHPYKRRRSGHLYQGVPHPRAFRLTGRSVGFVLPEKGFVRRFAGPGFEALAFFRKASIPSGALKPRGGGGSSSLPASALDSAGIFPESPLPPRSNEIICFRESVMNRSDSFLFRLPEKPDFSAFPHHSLRKTAYRLAPLRRFRRFRVRNP